MTVSTDRIDPRPRIAVSHAGSGPLLVFLHGIGGNRGSWAGQIAAFAPHFLAAAWDARGYGDSDGFGTMPVVTSDEDSVYPPDTARAMASRIPGAALTIIPGAGRVSNLDRPERFNDAVLDFLLMHAGGSGRTEPIGGHAPA